MRSFSALSLLVGLAFTGISRALPVPDPAVVVVTEVVHTTVGYTVTMGQDEVAAPTPVAAAPQNSNPVVVTVVDSPVAHDAQPEPTQLAPEEPKEDEQQPQPAPEEDNQQPQPAPEEPKHEEDNQQPQPAPEEPKHEESSQQPQPSEDNKPEESKPEENKQPQQSTNTAGASNKLWGLTYSPYNNDGSCADAGTVAQNLQKLSGLTDNIRLYSTDCKQLENALKAIKDNHLPMGVYSGIWLSNGDDRAQNEIKEFISLAKQYPGIIKGVSVGNEDVFKNSVGEEKIINYMEQVRSSIRSENLGDIPVYTTETDATYTQGLADHSDLIQINVFAIFDGEYSGDIAKSAQIAVDRVNGCRQRLHTDKLIRIGESGWSSAGSAPGNTPTSVDLEKEYMKNFVCQCASKNIEYFYFEAKNGDWKGAVNELEKNFGVFDASYNNKFNLDFIGKC